jgi:uncharacterized membrane protein
MRLNPLPLFADKVKVRPLSFCGCRLNYRIEGVKNSATIDWEHFMNNSKLIRILAPLLIASVVLAGCEATSPDVTTAPDLDVAGGSSAVLSEPTPVHPAVQMVGGLILLPFALALLYGMSENGLY